MSDELDEPVVRVTLGKIYDKLLEVDKKVDPLPATVVDHEKRLRALETRMWTAIGGLALLTFASPFVTKILFP